MLHIGESIRKCNKSATITKQRVETPFFIRVSERDGGFKSLLLRSKISEKPKENQGFLAFFGLEKCNSSDGVALFRRSTSY